MRNFQDNSETRKRSFISVFSISMTVPLIKVTLLHGCFFTFFKLYKWYNIAQSVTDVMCCAVWYHLYNFKKVKNTHGGVLLFVKLKVNFTKSNTPPWVFFTFFKLYNWCQIAQSISYSYSYVSNYIPSVKALQRHASKLFYSKSEF